MPSETLHFENARFAQQLLNNDAQNLHALEQILGVKATSREGWIKLEGSAEAVDHAKQLFQLLESSLKSGHPVRGRDFSHAPPSKPARPWGSCRAIFTKKSILTCVRCSMRSMT